MVALDVIAIDRHGIRFRADGEDEPVDVRFDERRIWSIWPRRDAVPAEDAADGAGDGADLLVAWPNQLLPFLHGHARVSLVTHLDQRVLYDAEARFGTAEHPIRIENEDGLPLGLDKDGRLAQTFDTRSREHVAPLLDATERVLRSIHAAGIDAFVAYGTLLGAFRDGQLIGHDSDADLGYVSRHTVVVDVIRESFALQRHLTEEGFRTQRYSGAAFKVDVVESDGSVRGLDVFGGFFSDDHLYLMGEVGVPFERDWIFPLGTVRLEGRDVAAPARPEKLLEAMYGPSWQVPDPAFKFETPKGVGRRLTAWFRGMRLYERYWRRHWAHAHTELPPPGPSSFAEFVRDKEGGVPAEVVELGCGRGADLLWWARQGARAYGLDFVPEASEPVQQLAAEEGLDLTVRWVNLNEMRAWLSTGSEFAHRPGPRTVVARQVADATVGTGRRGLTRLSEMLLRDGGRLYLELLRITEDQPRERHRDFRTPYDVTQVCDELRARGADIVTVQELVEPEPRPDTAPRPIVRIVAQWRQDPETDPENGQTQIGEQQ